MANQRFDASAFYAALDGERQARGKNWKQIAAEAKVSASDPYTDGTGKTP